MLRPDGLPNTTQSTIDLRRGLPEDIGMFDVIEDPRSGNATSHPFDSILFIALNLLKTETAKLKEPIRDKRIFAALDPSYLESIIGLRQV